MRYFLILIIFLNSLCFSWDKGFGIGAGFGIYNLSLFYSDYMDQKHSYNYRAKEDLDFSLSYFFKDFELETKYISISTDYFRMVGGSFKNEIKSLLFNIKFDPCIDKYCAYIGGGFNISKSKFKSFAPGPYEVEIQKASKFGFQGISGFLYKLSNSFNLYIEYVYFYNTGPTVSKDSSLKLDIYSMGFKYRF